MKTKLIIHTGVIAISIILLQTPVRAFGFGTYLTSSYSYYTWTYKSSPLGGDADFDYADEVIKHQSNGYKIGGGFVFDTSVATDNFFNYRFQVGLSYLKLFNNSNIPDIEGTGFQSYHNFGFGIIRNENLRIWLGPQIGVEILSAHYNINVNEENEDNDFASICYSGGVIAGVNYNFDNKFSLCFDGGFRYTLHLLGSAEIGTNKWNAVSGNEYEAFIDICFLFRPVDRYSKNVN